LGHESFGDILAAAWLGLLPPGQFLLGIANKGTEFAEYRPTVFQPPPAQSGKADVRSLRHFDFSQELCAHIDWTLILLCSGTVHQVMFLQDACKSPSPTLLEPRPPTNFSPERTARLCF
jgi:hypothetical protein